MEQRCTCCLLVFLIALHLFGCSSNGKEAGRENSLTDSTAIAHTSTPADSANDQLPQTMTTTLRPAVSGSTEQTFGFEEATPEERQLIEAWLKMNAKTLNKFGDPIGTGYPNNTPLYIEESGIMLDRHSYIKKQHPDAPWKKLGG